MPAGRPAVAGCAGLKNEETPVRTIFAATLMWCAAVQWGLCQENRTPDYPDHSRLLVYRDARGAEHVVRTAADWAIRRAHILAGKEAAMGPLPDRSELSPLDELLLRGFRASRESSREAKSRIGNMG